MRWIIMASLLAVSQPRELGGVAFGREFVAAKAEAAKTGKPLFVLFDEVPGCSNCTSFGDAVLSDPVLVSAIEDAFVPVAIFNNQGGADREVLTHFGEPAWNNPVVRLIDANETELAPRISDTYSKEPVARAMVAALQKVGRPVPKYLLTIAQHSERYAPIYLAAPCFWAGEACLGALESVAATRVGYIGPNEVVEVQASQGFGKADILTAAKQAGCTVSEVTGTFKFSPSDDKYSLRNGRFRQLDLNDGQTMRINSAVANNADPTPFLTPKQRQALKAGNL
jgi:hypothetical protein